MVSAIVEMPCLLSFFALGIFKHTFASIHSVSVSIFILILFFPLQLITVKSHVCRFFLLLRSTAQSKIIDILAFLLILLSSYLSRTAFFYRFMCCYYVDLSEMVTA